MNTLKTKWAFVHLDTPFWVGGEPGSQFDRPARASAEVLEV